MRTLLTTAYAINPYKGSEDGMGWNHILQIAKNNRVIAITRKNNLGEIQRYIEEHDLQDLNVEFHGYDLPYWMRFWKRGQNGAMAYYYLWQMFMPVFILLKKFDFDIAHNLNFHTDWIPTFLWVFGKPLVWGPVGHHPKVPTQYYHSKNTGLMGRMKNHAIWLVKKVFWTIDPFFYLAKKNADVVLCFSKEVAKQMGVEANKVDYMFSVGSEKVHIQTCIKPKFKVLSVGRLVPLKGFDMTIRSFHAFLEQLSPEEKSNVELVIVGKGELYNDLVNYVETHDLKEFVKVKDWMDREELKKLYETSNLFFFPSHEGAGMVVPEAFSYGVPTLCFDNNGPGLFVNETCGVKVPYSTYQGSIDGFKEKLLYLFHNKPHLEGLGLGALKEFDKTFLWDNKAERFKIIYESVLRINEQVSGQRSFNKVAN